MKTKITIQRNGGFASLMAAIFITLFSVLAISFTNMCNSNVMMSRNHRDVASAQAAAESGLAYIHNLIGCYIDAQESGTFSTNISDGEAADVYDDFLAYLQCELDGMPVIGGLEIGDSVAFDEAGVTGLELAMPRIVVPGDELSGFIVKVRQYDDDPATLEVMSIGNLGQIDRKVSLTYTMDKNRNLLNYSIASRSRVIITGDSTVEPGVYSDWEHINQADPIELSAESEIIGEINTTLSQADFPMDNIEGDFEGINYDQPQVELPQASDFDTSMYEDMTSTLPNSGVRRFEYYPHAPGDYTRRANYSSIRLRRTVYGPENSEDEPLVLTDKRLPSGGNSLFRNCVFEGVLYIGVGNGHGTNNVRFENCTFNGPVITGVPPNFGPETWKKNVLYFTGTSVFNNTSMTETTILAPNYSVNLGNTMTLEDGSESVLKGVVLGGVVDVRGNATIEGTIVSMAYPDPDDWGSSASKVATNIGFSDENMEAGIPEEDIGVITIRPPANMNMPMGIATKVTLTRNANSYVEY